MIESKAEEDVKNESIQEDIFLHSFFMSSRLFSWRALQLTELREFIAWSETVI